MNDDIPARVIEVLARYTEVPAEDIDLDTPLEEIGLDSIDAASVIFDLEDAFDVSVHEDEAAEISTVGEMVASLRPLVAAKRRSAA